MLQLSQTKKTILFCFGITLLYVLSQTKKVFAKITVQNLIRGKDSFGSGAFGADRTGHTHQGIDIVAQPGEEIFSPISGVVTRFPQPYANDPKYKGIEIKNNTYTIKIFYAVAIVDIGFNVKAGQKIAVAQNIASKYGAGMTNHIHFEVRKNGVLTDPTEFI